MYALGFAVLVVLVLVALVVYGFLHHPNPKPTKRVGPISPSYLDED